MHQVRSVGILSTGRIMAVVYGALGLIFVPFFLVMALAGAFSGDVGVAGMGMMAAVLLSVLMPLLYAAMGFIGGALGAFAYNLAAGWMGGIEVELTPPRSTAGA